MNLENKTTEQLIQMLANAMTTGATCGGHTKAHWNNVSERKIKEHLTKLGVIIPDKEYLYSVGVFNGEGAF